MTIASHGLQIVVLHASLMWVDLGENHGDRQPMSCDAMWVPKEQIAVTLSLYVVAWDLSCAWHVLRLQKTRLDCIGVSVSQRLSVLTSWTRPGMSVAQLR